MKKIVSLALVLGAGLLACSEEAKDAANDNATPPPASSNPTPPSGETALDPLSIPAEPAAGKAMIRAIHASPDAPAVDIYVKGNSTPVVTNLAYGQTSGWLEVDAGSYVLELRAAGAKPTEPVAYVTDAIALQEGVLVSAVAAGLLASNDTAASFRVLGVQERFSDVPSGIKVRAVHAAPDAPAVDLDIGNDAPGKPELAGLARFATTDGQIPLPADQALALGIAAGGARVTAFTTPKLRAGAQVLLVATGLLGSLPRERDGFALLAVGPNGSVGFIKQDPTVYALHASPDAPAIDIFAGAAELADNLSFGQLSRPIQVSPGSYALDFFGTTAGAERPKGEPAASASTGELVAGERYLAEATGFLGQKKLQLVAYRDGFERDALKPRLRAVHASPDAPAVDVGTLTAQGAIDTVLFPDLTFTRASAETGLGADAGHLVVGVAPTRTAHPVATFTIPAAAGQRAFAVAAGALAPTGNQAFFRFLVVDTSASPWTVSPVHAH